MTSNDKFVSTAINYLSGNPHLGHAYEAVCADFMTRSYRMLGKSCYFQTGSDEHGLKVAQCAKSKNQTPLEYCNEQVRLFQNLNQRLDITKNHVYVRTTDEEHVTFCRNMWNKIYLNGDIYLSRYEGWYSVREERYLTESETHAMEYKDGNVPLTKTSEPSFFFRLSKYQNQLIQHLKDHPDFIYPESQYNLIMKRLEEPLQDLSISRCTFDWGISVPVNKDSFGPSHVMYVWFDALFNYMARVEKSWNDMDKVHIIGKDIAWFHAVIWPCMLMSLGVSLPKHIVCHGFVNDQEGRKMSKSWNNGVDPNLILDCYGSDAFRYFFLREGSFGHDINYSETNLIQRHDSELVSKLSNLVHRISQFIYKHYGQSELLPESRIELFNVHEVLNSYSMLLDKFDIQGIITMLFEKVDFVNTWLYNQAPWDKTKDENTRLEIITTILESLYIFALLFKPIIPNASRKIMHYLLSSSYIQGYGFEYAWHALTHLPFEKSPMPCIYQRIGKSRHEKKIQ